MRGVQSTSRAVVGPTTRAAAKTPRPEKNRAARRGSRLDPVGPATRVVGEVAMVDTQAVELAALRAADRQAADKPVARVPS